MASSLRVRISSGHLCGAEAPTEPAGENAVSASLLKEFVFFTPRHSPSVSEGGRGKLYYEKISAAAP